MYGEKHLSIAGPALIDDLQDGVNLQHNGIYRDDPDAFLELQKVRAAVT